MATINYKDYMYYPMCVIEKMNNVSNAKRVVKDNQLLIKQNEKLRKENEQLKSKIRVMEGYIKFIGGSKDNEDK